MSLRDFPDIVLDKFFVVALEAPFPERASLLSHSQSLVFIYFFVFSSPWFHSSSL